MTKSSRPLAWLATAALALAPAIALAQSNSGMSNDSSATSNSMSGSSGTTSGPAAGTAATPGNGMTNGATPHQTDSTQKHSGSYHHQKDGQNSNGSTVQPGANGAESGQDSGKPQ